MHIPCTNDNFSKTCDYLQYLVSGKFKIRFFICRVEGTIGRREFDVSVLSLLRRPVRWIMTSTNPWYRGASPIPHDSQSACHKSVIIRGIERRKLFRSDDDRITARGESEGMLLCATIFRIFDSLSASPEYRYPPSIHSKTFIAPVQISIPKRNFNPIPYTLIQHNRESSVIPRVKQLARTVHLPSK